MPLLLARYVAREVLPLYVAGFVLFLFLKTTDLISQIAGVVLRNHSPLPLAFQVYLTYLPTNLAQILPAAVPFAILVAFGRLAKDSELKAISAGGIRPQSVLWPLVLLGLAVAALGFYNANVLTPAGNARFNVVWYKLYNAVLPPLHQTRYVKRVGDTLFSAGGIEPDKQDKSRASLSGVLVQTPNATYSAPFGVWNTAAKQWILNGYWEVREGKLVGYNSGEVRFSQTDRFQLPTQPPNQLTLPQLRASIENADLDSRARRDARFEYYRRFADPFNAVGFALAAGALGLLLRNRGWAFAAVVLMILGTYVLWSAMPQMVELAALPEVAAAWLPDFALFALGLGLAWRLR